MFSQVNCFCEQRFEVSVGNGLLKLNDSRERSKGVKDTATGYFGILKRTV